MSYTGATPDWQSAAACAGTGDVMFPNSNKHDIDDAKALCRACPVTQNCLQWALEVGIEHGVWGGLSEGERRALRRSPVRPISIDDYTSTPKTRASTSLTLQQIWETHTHKDGDHLLWTGPKVINRPQPVGQITPNRLAFYRDRGHWPTGDTKRSCGVAGCVKPTHLTDRAERDEEADLAVAV